MWEAIKTAFVYVFGSPRDRMNEGQRADFQAVFDAERTNFKEVVETWKGLATEFKAMAAQYEQRCTVLTTKNDELCDRVGVLEEHVDECDKQHKECEQRLLMLEARHGQKVLNLESKVAVIESKIDSSESAA